MIQEASTSIFRKPLSAGQYALLGMRVLVGNASAYYAQVDTGALMGRCRSLDKESRAVSIASLSMAIRIDHMGDVHDPLP